jgi:hypothetical protein
VIKMYNQPGMCTYIKTWINFESQLLVQCGSGFDVVIWTFEPAAVFAWSVSPTVSAAATALLGLVTDLHRTQST